MSDEARRAELVEYYRRGGDCEQKCRHMIVGKGCPCADTADMLGRTCTWREDVGCDGESLWDTDCGNVFCFMADGPKENEMQFCCYCGGRLVEEGEA